MEEHKDEFRIVTMCRVLGASRSGFYDWRCGRLRLSPRQQRRTHLDDAVKAAFVSSKGRSGSPRLALDLRDTGHACTRTSVATSGSSLRSSPGAAELQRSASKSPLASR